MHVRIHTKLAPTHDPSLHTHAPEQAVVAAAGCWEDELRYSEAMIERDVRNNSAWAQRAFVKLVGGVDGFAGPAAGRADHLAAVCWSAS